MAHFRLEEITLEAFQEGKYYSKLRSRAADAEGKKKFDKKKDEE